MALWHVKEISLFKKKEKKLLCILIYQHKHIIVVSSLNFYLNS